MSASYYSIHIPLFLQFLNRHYPNINFASETESSCTLAFLDVKITRLIGSFSVSIYHKPISTGFFHFLILKKGTYIYCYNTPF